MAIPTSNCLTNPLTTFEQNRPTLREVALRSAQNGLTAGATTGGLTTGLTLLRATIFRNRPTSREISTRILRGVGLGGVSGALAGALAGSIAVAFSRRRIGRVSQRGRAPGRLRNRVRRGGMMGSIALGLSADLAGMITSAKVGVMIGGPIGAGVGAVAGLAVSIGVTVMGQRAGFGEENQVTGVVGMGIGEIAAQAVGGTGGTVIRMVTGIGMTALLTEAPPERFASIAGAAAGGAIGVQVVQGGDVLVREQGRLTLGAAQAGGMLGIFRWPFGSLDVESQAATAFLNSIIRNIIGATTPDLHAELLQNLQTLNPQMKEKFSRLMLEQLIKCPSDLTESNIPRFLQQYSQQISQLQMSYRSIENTDAFSLINEPQEGMPQPLQTLMQNGRTLAAELSPQINWELLAGCARNLRL